MKCTAHKTDGTPCNAYAIKGKDVCRVHGGMTPIKHGKYSKYQDLYFGNRASEILDKGELLTLRECIALLQAMLEEFLTRLNQGGTVGEKERGAILNMVESITKNIERIHKLESEAEVPKVLNLFVDKVVAIGQASITSDDDRERFRKALAQSVASNGQGVAGNGKRQAAPPEGRVADMADTGRPGVGEDPDGR